MKSKPNRYSAPALVDKPKKENSVLSWPDFVAEFYRLLGRLVYVHSQFDRNVGLQLRSLGQYYDVKVADLLDPKKVPFRKRLKRLRKIVMDAFESSGAKGLSELDNFFKRADQATALRNDYVHGCWDWHYREELGKELILNFSPLHWDMSPDRPDDSITIELDEFEKQIQVIEKLFSEYFQLFDKYRRFAKTAPSKESKC